MKFFKFLFFATIVATMFITSCGKSTADGEYSLSFEVPDSVAYSFGVSMASFLKQKGVQSLDYNEFSKGMKKGIALKEEESNLLDSALNSIEAFAEEFIQGERVKIQADSTYVPALMDYPKAQSYDIGMIFGDNLTHQNYGKAEVKQVVNGLKDALNNSSKYTPEVTSKIFNEYLDTVDSLRSAVNEKYLADNKEKEGVITTPSSLQYEVLTKGDGVKPKPENLVKVQVKGSFVDGKSIKHGFKEEPISFSLDNPALYDLPYGLTESIGLMNIGSKYKFTLPANLAYGETGTEITPPNSTLIYEVELLDVSIDTLFEKNQKYLEENSTKPGVITTTSGLQYRVLKEGTGSKPSSMDNVKVHYKGYFVDGTVFDSSYDRDEPVTFPLNGVIPGWTEGVGLMSVGSKYEFTIPYHLGYGVQGNRGIPGKSTLVFEVELLEILPNTPQ